MRKKLKKLLIILAIIITVVETILIIINFQIKKQEELYYQATLNDNKIIKYVTKKDKIEVKLGEAGSKVYFNDEYIGKIKIKKEKNKTTEEYYLAEAEDYIKKVVYYHKGNEIEYSETYSNNDTLKKTSYYKNNQIIEEKYNNSIWTIKYKIENDKLKKYSYKESYLYETCEYDDSNTYETKCATYSKDGKSTATTNYINDKFGNTLKKTIIKSDGTTETHNFQNDKDKKTVVADTTEDNFSYKGVYKLQNLINFGSQLQFNTPYLYNKLDYPLESYVDQKILYYTYNIQYSARINLNKNGYSNNIIYKTPNEELYYELEKGVSFETFVEVYDYIVNEENDYNMECYKYIEKENYKDVKIKETITQRGNEYIHYYDWFTEEEITEEEYNKMIEELNIEEGKE